MLNLIKHVLCIVMWSLLLVLSGCMSLHKPAIPEEGLTLPELYHQTLHHNDDVIPSASKKDDPLVHSQSEHHPIVIDYTGYTRTANNEINSLFKPQHNPSVPLYIYPHLTQIGDEQIPVPGYTSSFFLYKQNRYVPALS